MSLLEYPGTPLGHLLGSLGRPWEAWEDPGKPGGPWEVWRTTGSLEDHGKPGGYGGAGAGGVHGAVGAGGVHAAVYQWCGTGPG